MNRELDLPKMAPRRGEGSADGMDVRVAVVGETQSCFLMLPSPSSLFNNLLHKEVAGGRGMFPDSTAFPQLQDRL